MRSINIKGNRFRGEAEESIAFHIDDEHTIFSEKDRRTH